MGVKSRGNFYTMDEATHKRIFMNCGITLCPSCGGKLINKLVEDETYQICEDCGSVA